MIFPNIKKERIVLILFILEGGLRHSIWFWIMLWLDVLILFILEGGLRPYELMPESYVPEGS